MGVEDTRSVLPGIADDPGGEGEVLKGNPKHCGSGSQIEPFPDDIQSHKSVLV